MRSWRAVAAAAVFAAAVWGLVVAGGRERGDERLDRPAVLLDVAAQRVERLVVRHRSGATRELVVRPGGALAPVVHEPLVPGEQLRVLGEDLSPLLAVRALPSGSGAGLGDPVLTVELVGGDGPRRLLVGTANFDRTAVYARVGGRDALVLPRVVTALAATVGQTAP